MVKLSENEKKWALTATVIGSGMGFINGSVVTVALPAIQSTFQASVANMQWVISVYAFMLGTLILTGGALGDHYGRKRIFGLGVFIFLLSALWCGLAPHINQLILARAGQGLGGALMIPGSLAIITDVYEGKQRSKAIGTWSAATALATAAGPLLGGILVDHLSWRYIFFISVSMAFIVLVILYLKVPETKAGDPSRSLDWPGALLATLGLGLICFGLIEGANIGIDYPTVFLSIPTGVLLMWGFVRVEKKEQVPMVPMTLFKSRNFTGANLITFCIFFSLAGVLFLMPFNLIQVQGYSATVAGAALLPFPILVGALSRSIGGLINRCGPRPLLTAGTLLTSLGLMLLGLYGDTPSYWTSFFPAISCAGLGIALSFAPLNTTVMNSVKESVKGSASGVKEAVSRLSGMLSVALLGALAVGTFGQSLTSWVRHQPMPKQIEKQVLQQKNKLAKVNIPQQASPRLQKKLKKEIRHAFLGSFKIVMYTAAGVAFLGAVSAAFVVESETEDHRKLEPDSLV